ncbi:MAG TPA: hypothetical protein VIK18_26160 [Pirellulales bacterium]
MWYSLPLFSNQSKPASETVPAHPVQMPTILPEFSDSRLRRFAVCASIVDSTVISRYRDHEPVDMDAQNADGQWYHVRIGYRAATKELPEDIHLHIDGVRSFRPSKAAPTTTLEKVVAFVDGFLGVDARLWVKGAYEIPKDALPREGIIQALTGIKTTAGGKGIVLSGARMTFEDRAAPFSQLEWTINGDVADVTLVANSDAVISESYLCDAVSLLTDGIARFVVEGAEVTDG